MSRPTKPWFRKSNKKWYVWHDGKQVNLGPDKKEAHQKFHQLMAEPKKARVIANSGSLIELVDSFLEWCQNHRAPDTYEWYRYRLERLCREYPKMRAASMRPYHVEDWVNKFDIAITTRRNYLRSAKRCFKWGRKQGYLDANPLADMEVPSAEEREVFLTEDDYQELLTYVRNKCLLDLVTVTRETGCRPQESLRAEARHVDLDHRECLADATCFHA